MALRTLRSTCSPVATRPTISQSSDAGPRWLAPEGSPADARESGSPTLDKHLEFWVRFRYTGAGSPGSSLPRPPGPQRPREVPRV